MKDLKNDPSYKHLTPVPSAFYSKALVSKNIRADLKKHFPNTKFSVRLRGDAIYINWTNGASLASVNKLVYLYQDHQIDPEPTDYIDYKPTTFTETFGGIKFLMVERYCTDDVIEQIIMSVQPQFKDIVINLQQYKAGHYMHTPSYGLSSIDYIVRNTLNNTSF